jgi:hypothetical protein
MKLFSLDAKNQVKQAEAARIYRIEVKGFLN